VDGQSVSPETLAAQALGEADPLTGVMIPVISPSTNHEQQPDGQAAPCSNPMIRRRTGQRLIRAN
jgi:hypothetical protein